MLRFGLGVGLAAGAGFGIGWWSRRRDFEMGYECGRGVLKRVDAIDRVDPRDIKHIELRNVRVAAYATKFTQFTALESVSCVGCGANDDTIKSFVSGEVFDFWHNDITDVSPLWGPRTRYIGVFNNKIDGDKLADLISHHGTYVYVDARNNEFNPETVQKLAAAVSVSCVQLETDYAQIKDACLRRNQIAVNAYVYLKDDFSDDARRKIHDVVRNYGETDVRIKFGTGYNAAVALADIVGGDVGEELRGMFARRVL